MSPRLNALANLCLQRAPVVAIAGWSDHVNRGQLEQLDGRLALFRATAPGHNRTRPHTGQSGSLRTRVKAARIREPDLIWGAFMNYSIDTEQEDDGRWIAEVPELPGVLAYGTTREEAQARAQVLALRVIAERLEHGEARPIDIRITVPAA